MIDKQADKAQSRNLRKALKTSNHSQVTSHVSSHEPDVITRHYESDLDERRPIPNRARERFNESCLALERLTGDDTS